MDEKAKALKDQRVKDFLVKAQAVLFTLSARPPGVDPALLELEPQTLVEVQHSLAGDSRSYLLPAADFIGELRAIIERQTKGFFTVNEAAQIIAEANPGIAAHEVRSRLRDAGRSGQLVIYGDDGFPLKAGASESNMSDLVEASTIRAWLLATSTGHQFPFASTFDAGTLEQILAAEKEVARCRAQRKPAPLLHGSSTTRLTKWVARETWTPFEAALLVCGYDPDTFSKSFKGSGIPGGTGLCGGSYTGEARFASAKQIADDWKRRVNSTSRVIPAEFVAWCDQRGVDTAWLGELRAPISTEEAPSSAKEGPPPALARWPAQELAILGSLDRLGYRAHALPPPKPGRISKAKQEVKADLRYSTAVMNKAWQRLLNAKRIKEA